MDTTVKLNFAQKNAFAGLSKPILLQQSANLRNVRLSSARDAWVFFFPKGLQMPFSVNRFSQGQQLVTKLVTAPVACGAVMVPSTMFMGQVVTAYPTFAAQQQQPQTVSITQPQQPSQPEPPQPLAAVQQPAQPQLTQHPQPFLQVTLHALQIIFFCFQSPDAFSSASLSCGRFV